jgi:hypothetical protein
MRAKDSRAPVVGQSVSWAGSREHVGLVRSVNWNGVEIDWANGKREFRSHAEHGRNLAGKEDLRPPQLAASVIFPDQIQVAVRRYGGHAPHIR